MPKEYDNQEAEKKYLGNPKVHVLVRSSRIMEIAGLVRQHIR